MGESDGAKRVIEFGIKVGSHDPLFGFSVCLDPLFEFYGIVSADRDVDSCQQLL